MVFGGRGGGWGPVLQLVFIIIHTTLAQQCSSQDDSCPVLTVEIYPNGYLTGGSNFTILQSECDAVVDLGELLSPALGCGDLDNLTTGFCKVFTEVGTRVSTCLDVRSGQKLFLVPQNRLFMWPTFYPGYAVEVRHVQTPNRQPIRLETISEEPKIFRLYNFFTLDEADELMAHALSITDDEHKLKRSSTGARGYNIDSKRTSENAFDTHSPVAVELKKRSFELLGITPYDETMADGLQILRYNLAQAYIQHLDWIDPVPGEHDYHSEADGANRYATILLYISDVEEGGETVFTKAAPAADHPYPEYVGMTLNDAMAKLESEGALENLPVGGWERSMVYDCRTKLAVKPMKATALLFYSQYPDGRVNEFSLHGACPVLKGQKWAANLWVWNGPRAGYSRKDGKSGGGTGAPKSVTFETVDVTGAELYYEDTKWGDLIHGEVFHVNTYEGHRWFVRIDGTPALTWIVDDRPSQRFILRRSDLP